MSSDTPRAHDDTTRRTVMPTARTENWEEHVPTEAREYIQSGTELDDLTALLDARDETDTPVRALLGGPTGAGKTTLAEYLAHEYGYPLFTIQASYSMHEADLLGSPQLIDNESVWIDGVVPRALRCSAERPCILLIDEVNRARPEAKSVLFSALDHRARVELPLRGHERIQGDETNLITIATINEGPGYFTQELDRAERRRLGAKWDVDYLEQDVEAELLTERTDVPDELATLLTSVADDIRDRASDDDSPIEQGVPTSAVLDWGSRACVFDNAGMDNPVVRAAEPYIITPFYSDSSQADEVESIIKSRVDGAPVDADELTEWMRSDTDDSPGYEDTFTIGDDTIDLNPFAGQGPSTPPLSPSANSHAIDPHQTHTLTIACEDCGLHDMVNYEDVIEAAGCPRCGSRDIGRGY